MSAQQKQPKKFNQLSEREQQAMIEKNKKALNKQLDDYREQQAQMARQRLPARPGQVLPARLVPPSRPGQVLPSRPVPSSRSVPPSQPVEPKLSDLDKRLKQIDSDEKYARELRDMELAREIAAQEASGSTSFLDE